MTCQWPKISRVGRPLPSDREERLRQRKGLFDLTPNAYLLLAAHLLQCHGVHPV